MLVPNTSTDNDFYYLNNCYSKIKSQSLSYNWSMMHEKMNEKYKNFKIAVYDILVDNNYFHTYLYLTPEHI